MAQTQLRARIAPTPSGYLHLGNVFNFLLTWLIVRKQGGILHLRIDDIDAARTRKAYVEDIFRLLDWLGIDYDEGPAGPDDFFRHHSQQLKLDTYRQALDQLWEKGHLFACQCSRAQVKRRSVDGQYPGTCSSLSLPADMPNTAWRLFTPPNTLIRWEDLYVGPTAIDLHQCMRHVVLSRKDLLPAYQIVSLIEDVQYEINFLVRGHDLLTSTAAQLFLAQLRKDSSFLQAQFLHHPLLKDKQQEKLSKSTGALAVNSLMAKWKDPTPCLKWMAYQLHLPTDGIQVITDLLARFELTPLKIRELRQH